MAKRQPKQSWFVYFEQINQSRYHVRATDAKAAIRQARKLWRADACPFVLSTELQAQEGTAPFRARKRKVSA